MHVMIADSVRFVSSLRDHSRFLDHALAACVPALADFGLVFLVDGERLRCAALAHASHPGRGLLRALRRVYKLRRDDRDSTVAQVVRIGRPALRREIRAEPSPAASASNRRQVLEIHRRLGARSALVVPIHGRDGVLGALALNYAESRREYTTDNIPLAEHIAMQIGFALDRGRLRHPRPGPPAVRRRLLARLRARA
jgi:GAF domain-containing protein